MPRGVYDRSKVKRKYNKLKNKDYSDVIENLLKLGTEYQDAKQRFLEEIKKLG